jgi:hypothetical protein
MAKMPPKSELVEIGGRLFLGGFIHLVCASGYGGSCIFYTDGSLIEGSLLYDTMLRLYGLRRDVYFSLNSIKAMLSRKIAHQTLSGV